MSADQQNADQVRNGKLAEAFGLTLPLMVLRSGAGFYIGTIDDEGPVSRESEEYYSSEDKADKALMEGSFTQRMHP